MKITVNTYGGPIRVVSLKQFIDEVLCTPLRDVSQNVKSSWDERHKPLNYGMLIHEMLGPCRPKLLEQIGESVSTQYVNADISIYHVLNSLAHISYINGGHPSMAVRLSHRRWLLANPQDFRIYYTYYGFNLSCVRPHCNMIYNIGKKL